jgi:hypothetical protein
MPAPKDFGYLMIDHRALPGFLLPPGVPRLFEASTYTCTHCSAVVIMNPERERERTRCHGCSHWICDRCAAIYAQDHVCLTYKQIAEESIEAAIRSNLSDTPICLRGK